MARACLSAIFRGPRLGPADRGWASYALVCKGGALVGVALCADLGQVCRPASPEDPTAALDADGLR